MLTSAVLVVGFALAQTSAPAGVTAVTQAQSFVPTRKVIQQVQRRLRVLGYDSGSADGVMGSQTIAALKAFQAQHNLPATGVLNQKTLDALGVEQETKSAPGSQSEHQREAQAVGLGAVTTAGQATPESVTSDNVSEERYERLYSNELDLQFVPEISSLDFKGRGLDPAGSPIPGFDVVSVDGVVKKLAVGDTDIELSTDRLGTDAGFLTVATVRYGIIRFEKTGYGLGVWLKPSQKKALLELLNSSGGKPSIAPDAPARESGKQEQKPNEEKCREVQERIRGGEIEVVALKQQLHKIGSGPSEDDERKRLTALIDLKERLLQYMQNEGCSDSAKQ